MTLKEVHLWKYLLQFRYHTEHSENALKLNSEITNFGDGCFVLRGKTDFSAFLSRTLQGLQTSGVFPLLQITVIKVTHGIYII